MPRMRVLTVTAPSGSDHVLRSFRQDWTSYGSIWTRLLPSTGSPVRSAPPRPDVVLSLTVCASSVRVRKSALGLPGCVHRVSV